MKKNILFLCTGNSCRSQMAEGFAKALLSDNFNAYSAGVKTHGLNPYAVKVMQEVGIDISKHNSKLLSDLEHVQFNVVVTVCDNAKESCPVFPYEVELIHQSFGDPPSLVNSSMTEDEKLAIYRKVRDEIKAFLSTAMLNNAVPNA